MYLFDVYYETGTVRVTEFFFLKAEFIIKKIHIIFI